MVETLSESLYFHQGDVNDNVPLIQKMLKKLGYYKASIDTLYGSVTYNAVKAFQKDNGLSQDGEAGPQTIPVLNKKYQEAVEKTSESEKKKEEKKKKIYVDDFKLDNTRPVQYTLEVFDEMVYPPSGAEFSEDTTNVEGEGEESTSTKEESHNKNVKLSHFKTTNLVGVPSWNRDGTGLTNEVTVTLVYNQSLMDKLHESQKADLHINNGNGTKIYRIEGIISSVKISHEDSLWKIEVSLTGYNSFLNMPVETYNKTCKQSEHLKTLIEMCGLEADLQLDGLPDEEVTINVQASSTEDGGDGVTAGAGATKTIDEIYQMAATFSYGRGCSASVPEDAWASYQSGNRSFDCYGCSSFLYYCLKNFAKIPCRIMQGYSPSSQSHTHRVVQIKENGEWHCPKQAWTVTRNLRPFTPEDRYTLHVHGGYQWDGDE